MCGVTTSTPQIRPLSSSGTLTQLAVDPEEARRRVVVARQVRPPAGPHLGAVGGVRKPAALGALLVEDVLGAPAEELLRGRVHVNEALLTVEEDRSVGGGVQHALEKRVVGSEIVAHVLDCAPSRAAWGPPSVG